MVESVFQKARKVKRWFKVELWGNMKSGKTRAALSFPRPCVIDTERGSLHYAEKYDFDVMDANHWPELLGVLRWLETEKHGYETLVIDSLTVFYQDLIDMQVEYVRNRRPGGVETLTHGDWGTIKRRWKSFMNRLIDLNMHVVLVTRQKDEYETFQDPRTGEDKSRKTGELIPDIEKSTGYLFDVILRCYTVNTAKQETATRYLVQVEGTRRDEVPQYAIYDVTRKRLYDAIFRPIEQRMLEGDVMPARPSEIPVEDSSHKAPTPVSQAGNGTPAPEAEKAIEPARSTSEAIGDILGKFTPVIRPDQPEATSEDIKVLMTRCGQMCWPSGEKFSTRDGKTLIKALYKVESTKDLRKPQIDFLYEEFGRVLAGRAVLARDEKGIPYVATKSEVTAMSTRA